MLLSGGLVALLLALTEGESWGWTSPRILGLAPLAVAAPGRLGARRAARAGADGRHAHVRAAAGAAHEHHGADRRLRDVRLVRARPELRRDPRVREHAGWSATASARARRRPACTCCRARSRCSFAGPLAGVLGRQLRARSGRSRSGCCSSASAALVLAAWHDEPWQIVVAMVVLGDRRRLRVRRDGGADHRGVRPTETGVATGMNTVMRTVGGVIGGQIGAALLTAHTIREQRHPREQATGSPSASARSPRSPVRASSQCSSRHRCARDARPSRRARSSRRPYGLALVAEAARH